MRVIQVTSSACCVVTDDSSSSSLSPPHPSLRCDRHPSLRCICEGGVALSRIPKHAEDLVTDRRQKRVFCNDKKPAETAVHHSLPPSLPLSHRLVPGPATTPTWHVWAFVVNQRCGVRPC
jgi:hypothetical protein